MATVDIRGARKTYPGASEETIKGIDCAIADGEFIVIVGPSGCGKSTLLRMVAGLERISSGEISIGERVVNNLEPRQRDIAMVFQNYALYPHMTVYRNMAYGLKIARMSLTEIDRRVKAAADILQIGHLLDRRPRQLSGGQRQRVAMGRAIVREPSVFLFDEPLSNLDAKLRVQMRVEIKKLQQQIGTTSIYVTHDQVEAMTMADRIVVMNHGVADQIGTPMEVYNAPASQFVAGFIGSPSMNFVPGRVTEDGAAVELPDGGTVASSRAQGQGGRPVTVGIRPEHLVLAEAGMPPERTIELTVDLTEALGADTIVYGRFSGHDEMLLSRQPGHFTARMGDRIALTVQPGALHLFDAETGRSLGA